MRAAVDREDDSNPRGPVPPQEGPTSSGGNPFVSPSAEAAAPAATGRGNPFDVTFSSGNPRGGGVRGHARSMSHVGILRTPSSIDSHTPGHAVSVGNSAGATSSRVKGHQRAHSQGQMNEGRGHKRESSRTDFILPEGHEQRERERELRPTKSTRKTSLKGHSREASRTESVYTIRDQKKSFLERLCFWKKYQNETSSRLVVPNHAVPTHLVNAAHPNSRYPSNKICTAKYTLLSFLPKNLFEQFHRFANLYFLSIVLLNFVPAVNAFVKEVAVTPLLFVLGVTAIKDAFEDRRRHSSDARVNGRTCRVYSSLRGCYEYTAWAKLRVGDVVRLSCDETIPADMVLLNTSDKQGVCYIESSNLDGETNLKQRQSIRGIGMDAEGFEVSKFDSIMEVGPPTTKIYFFVGSIPLGGGECVSLSNDNLLLRDCVVKNTDFVEAIVVYTGRETKALLNNGGTRYKRSKLERMMNHEVVWCVLILFLMALVSSTGTALWQRKYNENYHSGLLPFLPPPTSTEAPRVERSPLMVAFTSFWTFIILYQVLIPISLYVTIEIVKMMHVYHIHHDPHFENKKTETTINCRALNITEELGQVQHVFTDKTGTLTENEMVFQRCSINGIDYDHVPSVACEDQGAPQQSFLLNSRLEEALKSVELQYLYQQPIAGGGGRRCGSRIGSSFQYKDSQRVLDFFFTLAACNTVVVTKHRRRDKMNDSGVIAPTESSPTDLPEVPEVPYTTSSDTNRGLFRTMFTNPRPLSPIASSPPTTPDISPVRQKPTSFPSPRFCLPKRPPMVSPLFPAKRVTPVTEITLSTFEAVPDEEGGERKPRPTVLPLDKNCGKLEAPLTRPIYEAESPDELTLVDAAFRYGCRLLRRDLHSVVVALPGYGTREYEVLNVLPFDSSRKRMSVIVRHPETGEKVLYCKGADSAVLENLTRRADEATQLLRRRTENHLQLFSRKGLRVLCTAKRVLSDTEYEEWSTLHRQAEAALASREKKLSQSFSKVETEMQLTGATGIEDRLQDHVPETISALRNAGMKVWVLTGDKQETAINIAYSCALFIPQMKILKLNAHNKEQTERILFTYLEQIEEELLTQQQRHSPFASANPSPGPIPNGRRASSSSASAPPRERGLVVDGKTLVYILDRKTRLKAAFLRLTNHCSAVMCCRVNPLQKALVVRVAKEKLKVLTLAVGDGANDVSMIQTADVGVGISGVEGRQAVMASDFAVTRFHHLKKLLLVHGHWCYDRLARIILFFFYKNASFVFLLMWYQIFCGFSTAVMVDDLYLVMFNLLFTSLPPMAVGIYDQDASEELLMSQPHLYAKTRMGTVYTHKSFWINIIDAVYQSAIIFFVAVISYNHSDGGVYEFGLTITHTCLLTQLLHISIETKSWTVIHLASILLSYFVFFAFGVLYTVACNGCVGIPSMYGELAHMVTSPRHWCCVFLSVVLSLMPRFVIRVLQATLWTDEVTLAVAEEKQEQKDSFTEGISSASSQVSVSRPKTDEMEESRNVAEEDMSDAMSSLVTMTTIVSGVDETAAKQDGPSYQEQNVDGS